MRATDIKILTMGSAMLITSAAAMAAGPPISYDGFTSASGTISATTSGICGTTFTCGAELKGNGFYQRSLTRISDGAVFYQTIILPTNANVSTAGDIRALPFADENFIQQGAVTGGKGIADQQSTYSAGTTTQPGNLTSTTQINSGWAQATGGPIVVLNQSIQDPYVAATTSSPASGSDFFLDFGVAGDGTQATQLKINQSVSLCKDLADTQCRDPITGISADKQVLDVRRKIATSSDFSTSGGLTSALPSPSTALVGPAQISYIAGDIIQVVWLGQTVTTSDIPPPPATPPTPDMFGFEGYTNITAQTANPTSGTVANSYSSQTDTGPFLVYDPAFIDAGPPSGVFGAAPSF
jgi:hypothetical protein